MHICTRHMNILAKYIFTIFVAKWNNYFFFSLFIFPQAGPDIKYLLGFIRTQLSTSVTVGLVFGPKVII